RGLHPEIAAVFRKVLVPFDLLRTPGVRPYRVAPLAENLDSKECPSVLKKLRSPAPRGKRGTQLQDVPRTKVTAEYFEEFALSEADSLVHSDLATLRKKGPIEQEDLLQGAEKVLHAVLHFHRSERRARAKDPAAWSYLEDRILGRLMGLQV